MNKFIPTIGLEIHIELKTNTKMFCSCRNDTMEHHPNFNVCPICLGHPGTLPVMNKKAVELVIKTGLSLGGTINALTKFDRKNYFYPDLPKGYQISQYDKPIVSGGFLENIRIRRIHLEEDTATLMHSQKDNASLVDFNRAGVPLMEMVTEPDIRDPKQAVKFGKAFQLILRYLDVSDGDMEKGHMRIEANVSLDMGVKVEIKNINSFKALEAAINYEITRQKDVLRKGGKINLETRGWDDKFCKTVRQRSKEEAHDYRYFPEPDLVQFDTSVFDIEKLKLELPELPSQKFERFKREFGLSDNQARLLVENRSMADFFEEAASELAALDNSESSKISKRSQDILFNYLTTDLVGIMKENGISFGDVENNTQKLKVKPEKLARLVDMIVGGKIMSRQAKDILRIMFESGSDPEDVLSEKGLETISASEELKKTIFKVIDQNKPAVKDYKSGKLNAIQFLVGKAMSELKGRSDPNILKKMFEDVLGN